MVKNVLNLLIMIISTTINNNQHLLIFEFVVFNNLQLLKIIDGLSQLLTTYDCSLFLTHFLHCKINFESIKNNTFIKI